jgi:translation initiation factor 3 subunit H
MSSSIETRSSQVVVNGETIDVPQLYFEPIREVVIDCLAVLKIVKHCNDNLPMMVAGSLLGLDNHGVLEVTCVYPFPIPQAKGDDADAAEEEGSDYQSEMLKMLQKVNVDNNCVGWYTSMYFGTMCTSDVVLSQFNYQATDDLSNNCVVLMYDPIQSKRGSIVIKAFRLSDQYMEMRRNKASEFIKASAILEELPVRIQSSGHVSAFVRCLGSTHKDVLDCGIESLSLAGTDVLVEKNLELVAGVADDLLVEQQRLQQYARQTSKGRSEQLKWVNRRVQENIDRRDRGDREVSTSLADSNIRPLPEIPGGRLDHLLAVEQLGKYAEQVNDLVDTSVHKLIIGAQCIASTDSSAR